MTYETLLKNKVDDDQSFQDSSNNDCPGPLLVGNATVHHLGFVVRSISAVARQFAMQMSATWNGKIIHDPLQQVLVSFFSPADARNPTFELVEPAGLHSPVSTFLAKNRGGLHHVCYEVDGLEETLQAARRSGFVVVSPATPAAAFEGRRIAWICSKNRLLMELLERERPSQR